MSEADVRSVQQNDPDVIGIVIALDREIEFTMFPDRKIGEIAEGGANEWLYINPFYKKYYQKALE